MNVLELYNLYQLLNKCSSKSKYELSNCLERWAIAKLNKISGIDDKLVEEISVYPELITYKDKILEYINIPYEEKHKIIHDSGLENYLIIADMKIKNKYFTVELTDKMRMIFLKYGKDALFGLVERYLQLMINLETRFDKIVCDFAGQHWTVSEKFGRHIYKTYKIKNEAFASPFNSHSFGKESCNYYSVFEEDKEIGSSGNFFEISDIPPGNWYANPPYIESIMLKMAIKITEMLEYCKAKKRPILFYIIVPAWKNCEALDKLGLIATKQEDFYFPFVNHKGNPIKHKFLARYYIVKN
jgi:hypothetical protein